MEMVVIVISEWGTARPRVGKTNVNGIPAVILINPSSYWALLACYAWARGLDSKNRFPDTGSYSRPVEFPLPSLEDAFRASPNKKFLRLFLSPPHTRTRSRVQSQNRHTEICNCAHVAFKLDSK